MTTTAQRQAGKPYSERLILGQRAGWGWAPTVSSHPQGNHQGRHTHPHFPEEESNVQRGEVLAHFPTAAR